MFLRNLMAMDTEEMIRAQTYGRDRRHRRLRQTLPAQIMAAASVNLPTVVIPGRAHGRRSPQGRSARRLY